MLKKIDHIGIAVKSIDDVKREYQKLFQLPIRFEEVVEDQQVRIVAFRLGDVNLEFMEPTSPESPVARFLDKRGEGIHHICYEVENIHEVLKRLKSEGIQLIDETPRRGAEGKWIAFVHPRSMHGVLIELSQKADS